MYVYARPMLAEDADELLARLKEAEQLLQCPSVEGHVNQAQALLLGIARKAPNGVIANASMNAITLAGLLRGPVPIDETKGNLNRLLWRIRLGLFEAKSSSGG